MDPVSAVVGFLGGMAGKAFEQLAGSVGERVAKRIEAVFQRVYGASTEEVGVTQGKIQEAAAREQLISLLRNDLSFRSELRELISVVSHKVESASAGPVREQPLAKPSGGVSMRFGDVTAEKFAPIGQMYGGTVITADTVLMGWDPEQHAHRKTALAALELADGHAHAGLSLARDALRAEPSNAHASYYAGVALLMHDIRALERSAVAEAERCLARAADDPDLTGPCCYPRAAIRYDHYRYHRKSEPDPSLESLVLLEAKHHERARAWPHPEIHGHLGTSAAFRQLWWG